MELLGNMIGYLRGKKFVVHPISQNAESEIVHTNSILINQLNRVDWLIVDNYNWDINKELSVRPHVHKIMVIDDMANRKHDCDILLDQNLVENYQTRYTNLVPKDCTLYLGPEHAIVRNEFSILAAQILPRKIRFNRVLVFFGGADQTNETLKTLHALIDYSIKFAHVDVVVGISNPNKASIQRLCHEQQFDYYCQTEKMAELMALADLSIGAGGTAMWERAILGLPTIVIGVAFNQMDTINQMGGLGAIKSLGWHEKVTPIDIAAAIDELYHNREAVCELSERSINVMGIRTIACEKIISKLLV
jgi:UDP-2,4-diacetamido-2,4,6-trideoxy-beta-L-altropyranose hydrolase